MYIFTELRLEDSSTLLFANRSVLRKEQKLEAAKLIQKCFESPGRPAKMLKLLETAKNVNLIQMSSDEALSIIIDAELSRTQYNVIRRVSKMRGKNIFEIRFNDCIMN